MSQSDSTAESRELDRVAQEFREKGYDVLVRPATSELPSFLRDYQPDLIARSKTDSVIVEVKRSVSAADQDRFRAISERVERQPGWRFLLLAPRLEEEMLPGQHLRTIDKREVERLLREARELQETGHTRAALLIAWSAVEAAMRSLAEQEQLQVRRPDTWTLLRELVSQGIVDRARYDQLKEAFTIRTALSHGLRPDVVGESDGVERVLEALISAARELLAETRKA